MSIKRRLKELNKKINSNNGKKEVLFFTKISNNLYSIELDNKIYNLKEEEFEEFKNDYGAEDVVCIIEDI